jgi:hypothetical protein
MDMPVNERRLNIKFINEHLEKMQEIQQDNQMITASKPMPKKPNISMPSDVKPTYTSKVKSKK